MKKIKPLLPSELCKKVVLSQLHFRTTRKISAFTRFVGQDRAREALNFGIKMESAGYNLYAMGPSGIGKRSLISSALSNYAGKREVPPDWCYLYNFDLPEKPIAVSMPKGMGLAFQADMKAFINEVSTNVLAVLDSKEYQFNLKKIQEFYEKKCDQVKDQKRLQAERVLPLFPEMCKAKINKESKLQHTAVMSVIKPFVNQLKKKYQNESAILHYLHAVQNDITHHIDDFIKKDEKTNLFTFELDNPLLEKYKINLFVDNSHLHGAPVIFEEDPSYSNIICRVEYASHSGTLATNFTLLKPGSLHQANGGYLIIAARKLKKNQESWEALKNALYAGAIHIKPIEHQSDLYKPVSLEPMPIPLNVKVVLLGDRNTYYSLCRRDPDFLELFKVAVDFDEQIDRNKTNIHTYARFIGAIAKRKKLGYFHASAVAEVIAYSSRLAEDNQKLSVHMRDIEDLMLEAHFWAASQQKNMVYAEDVRHAIEAKIHRADRARDIYYEEIDRHFIIIHTDGSLVGQVNCLSVRKVGDFSYGHPTRVTARVRLGHGKIIDIQREIKMAGPAHSKASLIIAHFLASQFNHDQPFALHASISFEQIYCWTDGDSASVGELCAVLSALSDIPINQQRAVTGSIDQYGTVQAIGGVNEKIEGFFDVCKIQGFTGLQGVIIPEVNKKNLMLRADVVAAVKARQFNIYPIKTIDEAIQLLMLEDVQGRIRKNLRSPKNIYEIIQNKLRLFTKNSREQKKII